MLIALIGLFYLLMGGGLETVFDDLDRREVRAAIENPDTRSVILDLSDELGDRLKKNRERMEAHLESYREVARDYDSTREDFAAEAARLDDRLAKRQAMLLETRAAMRERLSREEWQALFAED